MHGEHDYWSEAPDRTTEEYTTEKDPRGPEFDDCTGRHDEQFTPPPVPPPTRGLIEVQFTEGADSGVKDGHLEHPGPIKEFPGEWQPELANILREHKLLSWKPAFPLRYSWSRKCSKDSARLSYKRAKRDKYVSFQFSRDADLLTIADRLRKLDEIKQAVAVPDLAPPAPARPLAEPFVGTSDQVVPICGPEGCLSNQWYLHRCGVPEAWAKPASGAGVVIADIDWGFDLTHQDLARTELTRNVIRDLPNVSDGNLLSHGNGALGLAGAAVNGQGMAGIAFGATLWAIQAGMGNINRPVVAHEFWVEAIDFVRDTPSTGRKIIILELQTAGFSNPEMIPSISAAITQAINAGIVVCVPAGNGNQFEDAGVDDFGVAFEGTDAIVVGATKFDPDPAKNVRAGSNGGERVTVYAPGDHDFDLTCGLGQRYRHHFGGTSGATAKVAGVVALMLEKNSELTPQDVADILAGSLNKVSDELNPKIGVLVDANQAVTEAMRRRSLADGTLPAARMGHDEDALRAA